MRFGSCLQEHSCVCVLSQMSRAEMWMVGVDYFGGAHYRRQVKWMNFFEKKEYIFSEKQYVSLGVR